MSPIWRSPLNKGVLAPFPGAEVDRAVWDAADDPDEMPKLRYKAAEQLVAERRDESRMTLVQALHRDASMEVRTAAKNSLEKRPTY